MDNLDSFGGATPRKLWWLMTGRIAVASALLLLKLWGARASASGGGFAGALLPELAVAAVAALLTLGFAAALKFSSAPLRVQAGAQFFCDVLLVSWLIGARGELHSPYAALYIVVIAVAGVFVGVRGALLTAVGCASVFTAITLAGTLDWLPGADDGRLGVPFSQTLGTIALHDVAFLVVGLLAARLAERQTRSDEQLMEAAHALANLRALHERIVESIRSGLLTTDLEGRIYTFNAAAEEMTGYKASDLRGQDASILFGDIRAHIDAVLKSPEEEQKSQRYEADCLTPDGMRLRLGYSISPLYAEGGEVTGLILTFQDLTQVRALEETSRRQDRLAAVGRVAAGIAHEIRNPLAAMRGSIQVLLSETDGDSAEAELMEIILRESDRINRIITDYLTYARPRPLALAETDVREPLRETFALLPNGADVSAAHRFELEMPEEPARAMADASGLKQVFWNLARNAVRAMPEGGTLRAEIKNGNADAAAGRLRIVFTDTGCGMSPKQVERLFEPFTSSTTGGTGLGLSIVYQIVRDHGGTINVRSREGYGTTITIELPEKQRIEDRG
ncbi:MAG: two-component system sensor histidine kinase NtrB [Pyrinomonadaceae bacterium]